MAMINPIWHSLSTAGMIGAIALLALVPNPLEFDYRGIIKGAITPSGNTTETTDSSAAADGAPPKVLEIATKTSQAFGIPLGVILAIAAHESGNYRAIIGANSWGLKCVNNHASCTTTKTTEYTNGVQGSYRLSFESCEDADRCSRLLGQTLTNLNTSGQWQDIPAALAAVGQKYATDPQWSTKVLALMEN